MAWGDNDPIAKVSPAAPTSWGANDPIAKKKPNGWMDAAQSYASGLGESALGFIDTAVKPFVDQVNTTVGLSDAISGMMTGRKRTSARLPQPSQVATSALPDLAYQPQTTAGEFAHTAGLMTVGAAAPGSLGARVANVVIPTLTTEGAGQLARAAGAGPKGEAVARFAGGVVGAGMASMRPQNLLRAEEHPAGMVDARARQNPVSMTQRAEDFRSAGMSPTLTDVVDDSGRGVIRAAGNRMTEGRQVANDFATGRALDLPSRIGNQARRVMSSDPRTPDEIRASMAAARGAHADTAFGAVRGDTVDLGVDGLDTLRIPEVVDAIGEAMRRERDPAARGALEQLAAWAGGDHSSGAAPQITIGMADRISRVLLSKARATNDADLRATLTQFGEAIRSPARDASPGYASALEGYGADSRLHAAAGVGEGLMTRNTDEFAAGARRMSDPERELALASGRRAIERKAGENIGAAPRVARSLADAPEQQARNAALMGPARAGDLQHGMRMEARAVDNARMIQPKAGSGTHLNDADAARVADGIETAVRTGSRAMRHDWAGIGLDWLRSRGMNDAEAEALVRLATDPTQTEAAIQAITARRLGSDGARDFLRLRNAALLGGVLAATPVAAAASQERRAQ
jgi:hypothetical protein